MMNLLIAAYIATTTANEYWFGFTFHHMVYVITGLTFTDLLPFIKIERAAQSKGGHAKLRIKARSKDMAALLPKAMLLGSEDILIDDRYNAGTVFEKIVTEELAGQTWSKDSVPYWISPDLELDGRKIQVKFNGAEVTNEKTIRRHFPEYLPT